MDFRVPELGEGVYEAELVAWKVKPGDAVKRGQTLMEVLTDKATMEVPAAFAGTIRKLQAEPGQEIKVGEVVLSYDPAGQAAEAPPETVEGEDEAEPAERKPAKAKRQAEDEGEPEEAERKPAKPKRQPAEDEDKPAEDKKSSERGDEDETEREPAKPKRARAEAAASGDGAKAKSGGSVEGAAAAGPAHRVAAGLGGLAGPGVKAAPSVRLMARKLGLDLGQVEGSGPHGRILVEDLTRYLHPAADGGERRPRREEPKFDLGKPGARIKLQGVRRKIAEHMVQAKRAIPHYSYMDECDVSELVRLRQGLRDVYQRKGVKLTYLAFFVKAAVAALKEVPLANASLDEEAGEIVLHDHYNIGIAVAAPAGLIVPVVHDADRKDLLEVAREVERLGNDARAGKARLEDLRGGTFTITSIGNIGGLLSTPIINHPQVAILGIGKIVKRPVFDEHGQLKPADLVYLSFSFDHRVVDGAIGAVFGNALMKQLQNPAGLLVD